jgi:hypothetical protein
MQMNRATSAMKESLVRRYPATLRFGAPTVGVS